MLSTMLYNTSNIPNQNLPYYNYLPYYYTPKYNLCGPFRALSFGTSSDFPTLELLQPAPVGFGFGSHRARSIAATVSGQDQTEAPQRGLRPIGRFLAVRLADQAPQPASLGLPTALYTLGPRSR